MKRKVWTSWPSAGNGVRTRPRRLRAWQALLFSTGRRSQSPAPRSSRCQRGHRHGRRRHHVAQVEFDGPDAKNGFVELMTSAEVNQSALQAILYDIEAGLPYLFIEKLSLQSPEDFGEPETGRMRITIAVAGQWRASK